MKRMVHRLAAVIVAILGMAGPLADGGAAQAQVFQSRSRPNGIAVDVAGSVYLQWDAVTSYALSRFAPDGTLLGEVPVGSFQIGSFDGKIAQVPGTNALLLLSKSGIIYLFGPDLQAVPFFDLSSLAFQVAPDVLDVTFNQIGSLQLGNPDWGDIAVLLPAPTTLYVFVSATTGASGSFPFVLRIFMDLNTGQLAWRVVARSSVTTAGNVSLPRGLAVNPQGWVLSALPFLVPGGGFSDSLVAFSAAFPEVFDDTTRPRFILPDAATAGGIRDVAATGMTADVLGNFYVATGAVGSTLCGGPGIVVVGPNPAQATSGCLPLSGMLTSSPDVAVSPIDLVTYLTFDNGILRFPPLVTPPAAATAMAAGARSAGPAQAGALTLEKLRHRPFRYTVPYRQ